MFSGPFEKPHPDIYNTPAVAHSKRLKNPL
jgi:hypothetical protein